MSRAEKGLRPTFGEFADGFIAAKSPGWRSANTHRHWTMTLRDHAAPLRSKLVDEIATEDVLAVLRPLWLVRHDTAVKLRGRIETVLDAAKAAGHRSGDNPARWRGHLDHLLAKLQKLDRPHHPAMPFCDVPAFVRELRKTASTAALALEFVILSAARVGEVLGARWDEIDLVGKVWTVPASRMKSGRTHRVPLSERALEILAEAGKLRSNDFVFPSQRAGRPFSTRVLRKFLRTKTGVATNHGFRSSFRDWAGETTRFAREVAEAALAHSVGDESERAYRRGDALEKRRAMMKAWASFCSMPGVKRYSSVVVLREKVQ